VIQVTAIDEEGSYIASFILPAVPHEGDKVSLAMSDSSDTVTEEMRSTEWEVDRVVWVPGDDYPVRIVIIEEDDEDEDEDEDEDIAAAV
jgi:hypothetical protein